ncbi:hypothetical protein [Cesiribacter sp. SM1]|uniref:hypothetical protein n=1 Tax=Cesiribacter sp. SM1 TaxID=2861196 RepID=UPI001CD47C8C|nr:hypothetical protein [Cesiribacter sp. SM1]
MTLKYYTRLALILLLPALLFGACEKSAVDPDGKVSNGLHFAFKTPDWEKRVDLTNHEMGIHLGYHNILYTQVITSPSLFETFIFTFPMDSSSMVKAGNLKKYAIEAYGENKEAFQFSLRLPVTAESSNYLISKPGLSEKSYNEVVAITYVRSTDLAAHFRVKCRYRLLAATEEKPNNVKEIYGTFNFEVRTSRN